MLRLPVSGVTRISPWVVVLVSFVGGLFTGFLGGGAGYIRMPLIGAALVAYRLLSGQPFK